MDFAIVYNEEDAVLVERKANLESALAQIRRVIYDSEIRTSSKISSL